jgi:site-specific DNA-methyltransferase (adenine-specific)
MNFGKTKKISGGGQTTRYPSNILKFDSVKNDHSGEDKLHHNQKPVALLEYLIKTYTDEKNLVLDNCIGSGSTAVAAIKTNRNFIGIEKDPYFFKIAKDRITIK